MKNSIKKLNQNRKEDYYKDPDEENFIQQVNENLLDLENSLYGDVEIEHPFIFIFGLPRSGTTLISQVLAHCMDTGFINNFMARFWLTPVCGIRLAQNMLKNESFKAFQSNYGATNELLDIHEFGYFWRKWMKKNTFENIRDAKKMESDIDWQGLKYVLANMQQEFGKPMVFKNILGSYHLQKMKDVLGKVLYIYIERDPLDVAVSILKARKKYYRNLNTWWSYAPPEVLELTEMDYWHQIAGQIHYLKKFYYREMDNLNETIVVRVNYKDLCQNPASVLDEVRDRCKLLYQSDPGLVQSPPDQFPVRNHDDHPEIKAKFKKLLKEFEEDAAS